MPLRPGSSGKKLERLCGRSHRNSQNQADHTLFYNHSSNDKLAILIVYVDDIIFTRDNLAKLERLKKFFAKEFEIKDLGTLKYLGMEFGRSKEDTAYLMTDVSQFMHSPNEEHLERGKKQPVVARSSVETELRAATHGIFELLWLKKLFEDLRILSRKPMKLYCDNNATINIAHNLVQYDRTKQVEVDHHFIKEKLEARLICMPYVPTEEQLADGNMTSCRSKTPPSEGHPIPAPTERNHQELIFNCSRHHTQPHLTWNKISHSTTLGRTAAKGILSQLKCSLSIQVFPCQPPPISDGSSHSLAKTCVCLGKASSSSPVTFLLCLGPDIPGSSSTAVIRPPFKALFNPNVIHSQRPWNSSLWDKVMRIILLHLRMLYLMLTKCNGRKLMHNYEAYYAGHGFVYLYWPDCVYKEEFLTLMPFTNGAEAQQIQTDKFFMVLTLIGLRLDLESVRDQILASPSVPSLDDPLRLTLEEDVVAIGIEDNVLSAPIVISLVTLEIIAISYMDGLLALPTLLNHLILCYLDLTPLRAPHLRVSPLLTGNVSVCFTQSPSLGPWILDSGVSDHISSNKHLFSSITTTSALPTVTLANGSQTIAKGIGLAHPLPSLPLHSDRSTRKTIGIGHESQGLYHLTSPSSPIACISTDAPLLIHSRLGHPSLSKFQKMVPRFSTLLSLA
ncbi:Copia protein [Vitis vinifera]|uniref:Copia protein n=1 Tax=Vitis vinifera TaxID=29760 RepID=A0A438EUF6_VITVI|nr:Copia protein [Vitis vinifera]